MNIDSESEFCIVFVYSVLYRTHPSLRAVSLLCYVITCASWGVYTDKVAVSLDCCINRGSYTSGHFI